jgi:hypothetical protein
MTRIRANAIVQYPADTLERLLVHYMDERRRADGSIRLPLRAHARKGGRGTLAVEHDVIMRFRRGRDSQNVDRTFFVDWVPAGDGPYPTFTGFMTVYAEIDTRFSRLEIDGTYTPPGGVLGGLFDAAIGKHLAQASIADFIDSLVASIAPNSSSGTRM